MLATRNRTLIRNSLTFGVALVGATHSLAAGSPEWNRRTEAISIVPTAGAPTGVFDIGAHVLVSSGDSTVPRDLSSEVEIRINGTTAHLEVVGVTADPCSACAPFSLPCVCTASIPPICVCGSLPVQVGLSGVSLDPGDEIMVLLRPAPGALPESDTSDDVMIRAHDAQGLWWNRRIASIALVPLATAGTGGPGSDWAVEVHVGVDTNYDGPLALGAELELFVNGAPAGTTPVFDLGLPLEWNPCAGNCTDACVFNGLGQALPGACSDDFTPCACAYDPVGIILIPEIGPDPGDDLKVILRPVPGALPELPGFPEDDEGTEFVPCDADLDGNGVIGFNDLNLLLAAWGPCAGCPEDLDGNGTVGFVDLNMLLAAWGPCAPV